MEQDEAPQWLVNNIHPMQKKRLLEMLLEDEE